MRIHERTLHLTRTEAWAYGVQSRKKNVRVDTRDVTFDGPLCPLRRWQELTECIELDQAAIANYDGQAESILALWGGVDWDHRALELHEQQLVTVVAIAATVMVHEIEVSLGIPHEL